MILGSPNVLSGPRVVCGGGECCILVVYGMRVLVDIVRDSDF